jgi:hypothetical protein
MKTLPLSAAARLGAGDLKPISNSHFAVSNDYQVIRFLETDSWVFKLLPAG